MNISEIRSGVLIWAFLLAWVSGTGVLGQTPATATRTNRGDGLVMEIEGKAEVLRQGAQDWTAAFTNQTLRIKDRFRTHLKSRAVLQLSSKGILRVGQLTTLEVQPPTEVSKGQSVLDVKTGSAYFFNRDDPIETQFRTPQASGAIRGTEFNIEVAEDGRTVVTLLDGAVDLFNDFGQVSLASGEQATVDPGQAPRKTAVIDAINIIQWSLYYPGVLDPSELELSAAETKDLADSLQAYRAGDLLQAAAAYPTNRANLSPAETVYAAAIQLAVGQVNEASAALVKVQGTSGRTGLLAGALRKLIAAVKFQPWTETTAPSTATEWMAESYYQQSRSHLEEARAAARSAGAVSPNFGFAWSRLAELEFSFGRVPESTTALNKGLELAPRNAEAHALRGFLYAAENRIALAAKEFDEAIALDGALGNAWLGRGLIKIRSGQLEKGREDLQVAATLEPHRAVLRSYLGKAFSDEGDLKKASKEIDLAKRYDPSDPTSWLYSALLKQSQNRVNEAVRDLEQSQNLNTNRSVFRSRMLLDQDRAVRSANLAKIYQDAGLADYSVREASRAVSKDYANASAHQFLANSYDALRDPRQINLRYETPWFSELLLANMLAPVGAGSLSQNVSQQEYSKLFERDRLSLNSSTEYFSSGGWVQDASQFGTFGNSSYSLDAYYRTDPGQRPNNDIEQLTLWAKFKQQITPQDSLFFMANYFDSESGDVAQYYNNQTQGSRTLRVTEKQDPNVFAGLHHDWNQKNHTLFLAGFLNDTLTQTDPAATALTLTRNAAGQVTAVTPRVFGLDYRSELTAYSFDAQHILDSNGHTFIGGLRYQTGTVDTDATLNRNPVAFPPIYGNPPSAQSVSSDLERFSAYGYYLWQILEPLQLIGGISYDRLTYPENSDIAPLSSGDKEKEYAAPKAGFILEPWKDGRFRGVFTRSLGGVFYDQSVRLEPSQLAGFNQAFRSILPESISGLLPGSKFESFGLGFDQRFSTGTYVDVVGEILNSQSDRAFGAFDFQTIPAVASSTPERLDYEEKSVTFTVNQLLSTEWSVGASYRFTDATLNDRFLDIPTTVFAGANRDLAASLQQVSLNAFYNLPCGFFSQLNSLWSQQSNRGYTPDIAGDDFWQFNAFAGYRFPRRQAEIRLGVLNIADQDYQLNPLNLYTELPRERTFTARLRFSF